MNKQNCIYVNGDSFAAGVELADEYIPEYPGLLSYPWPTQLADNRINYTSTLHEKAKEWIASTYDQTNPLHEIRINAAHHQLALEYYRAFPYKIQKTLGVEVINSACGGASMDRIVRTAINDLLELKKEYTEVIAVIGLTHPSRFELPTCEHARHDFLGHYLAWQSFSTAYRLPYQRDEVTSVIDYMTLYADTFHFLINFYYNINHLQCFCKQNGIKLYWVNTHTDFDIEYSSIGNKYENVADLANIIEHTNLEFTVNMLDIVKQHPKDALCPSGHYSEHIHEKTAAKLCEKLIADGIQTNTMTEHRSSKGFNWTSSKITEQELINNYVSSITEICSKQSGKIG